jgi:tRNA 2-thiouridine synthesizing protein A
MKVKKDSFNNHNLNQELIMSDFDSELDASGLNCPLPILRAKKAIAAMDAGQTLKIIATDPGSVKDFEAFCKQTGNELVSSGEEDVKFVFAIKKAA